MLIFIGLLRITYNCHSVERLYAGSHLRQDRNTVTVNVLNIVCVLCSMSVVLILIKNGATAQYSPAVFLINDTVC